MILRESRAFLFKTPIQLFISQGISLILHFHIKVILKRYGVPHPYPLPSLWRSSPGWLRNFPGLITASRFLWDFCKIPQKSSFFVIFGLATTVVACATQLEIEVLFLDFWRF